MGWEGKGRVAVELRVVLSLLGRRVIDHASLVLALGAAAVVSTGHTRLETFAVLLETVGLFAMAALLVANRFCDFRSERVCVALQCHTAYEGTDGRTKASSKSRPDSSINVGVMLWGIMAVYTIAAFTAAP